jgi:ribosome recycling factor
MSVLDELYKQTEDKMRKALEATRTDFSGVRTGRASTGLVERLHVEAYGQSVPLKTLASLSTPDARTVQISAFDRSMVGAIRKAIETSDLGLSPNVDGQNVRLSIPPLTEDRRKELVKVVHKKAEEGKIAVRNVRHKSIDELKGLLKDHSVTEDENKRASDTIQKLTDKYVKEVDVLTASKEKEILEV